MQAQCPHVLSAHHSTSRVPTLTGDPLQNLWLQYPDVALAGGKAKVKGYRQGNACHQGGTAGFGMKVCFCLPVQASPSTSLSERSWHVIAELSGQNLPL